MSEQMEDVLSTEALPLEEAALGEETEELGAESEPTFGQAPSEDAPNEDELTRLREEVTQLRDMLSKKEAEQEQILREMGEFNRLFPEIPIKQVPDSVWQRVEGGLPLSAAYALYERETRLSALRAEEINRKNAALSPGKAGKDTAGEYFSPDEVRAMSQKQVHDNYAKIMESMKRWH